MKISELEKDLGLSLLTEENYADRELTGCYIGDLLSWVMGKAQAGNVWITIMNNINIAAVASLTDVGCIVLCEGVTCGDSIISKANSEGIIIFSCKDTAYELAVKIGKKL